MSFNPAAFSIKTSPAAGIKPYIRVYREYMRNEGNMSANYRQALEENNKQGFKEDLIGEAVVILLLIWIGSYLV